MRRLSIIHETKQSLSGIHSRYECRLVFRDSDHAVVLYILDQGRTVADLTLPEGTVTMGYFWPDRTYNVYHWTTPGGQTLAYYFNLVDQTRVTDLELSYRDLEVDVLLRPAAAPQILDQDLLPADLDPGLRRTIESNTQLLLTQAHEIAAEVDAETTRHWPAAFGVPRT